MNDSGTMGHSHSSSHKRLQSISSGRNCGEFTEIVDLEFSDASMIADTVSPKTSDDQLSKPTTSTGKFNFHDYSNSKLNKVVEEQDDETLTIRYPKDLLSLEDHVKEVRQNIENMPADEFFIYFPTLKDDLHNCWQKVYSIKEPNLETKLKKYSVIDSIRELLRKMNAKLQRRNFNQQNNT